MRCYRPRGENPRGHAYTSQNILATLYRTLGINPETTINDQTGRPIYLLDERNPVEELI
ncbi:MAG: hypothetical protein K2X38_23560 [Gemmataceae bacterium]|nr:hypothetical protein [Gemmataceae bacterium]